jgi:hypothetical protein
MQNLGWQALKALPLGVGVPALAVALSVKPHDVASNISAWADYLSLPIPDWARNPTADHRVLIGGGVVAAALYIALVWGMPLWRRRKIASASSPVGPPSKPPSKYLRSDAEALVPILRRIYEIQYESVRDTTSLIGPLISVSRSHAFHQSNIQFVLDSLQRINQFYFNLRRDLWLVLNENISFRDELIPYIEFESQSLRDNMSTIITLVQSIPPDEWQPKQWPVIIDFIGKTIAEIKSDYKKRGGKVIMLDAKMRDIKESIRNA